MGDTDKNLTLTLDADTAPLEQKLDVVKARMDELQYGKPGVKTSEFWLTLAAIAFAAISHKLDVDPEIVWGVLGLAGIYTGGRTFVKR